MGVAAELLLNGTTGLAQMIEEDEDGRTPGDAD